MEITDEQVNIWARQAIELARKPHNEWDKKAIDWPHLTEDSVVFEVGAYKGRWAYQIATKYNPRLFCFEPQLWAFLTTCKVLEGYNATVVNSALGRDSYNSLMANTGTDGATFNFRDHNASNVDAFTNHKVSEITITINKLEITHIDLMSMNIEGYEFTLLPHMFKNEIFPDILMVQFHDYFGDTLGMMELIDSHYSERVFDYGSTLTAWRR